jgi:hypothetical protein
VVVAALVEKRECLRRIPIKQPGGSDSMLDGCGGRNGVAGRWIWITDRAQKGLAKEFEILQVRRDIYSIEH